MRYLLHIILSLLITKSFLCIYGTETADEEAKRIHALLVNWTATPPPLPISQQECAEYCKDATMCMGFSIYGGATTSFEEFNARTRKTQRCMEAQKICSCRTTPTTAKPVRDRDLLELNHCATFCNKDCSIYDYERARACRTANANCVCGALNYDRTPDSNRNSGDPQIKATPRCTGPRCSPPSPAFWWTVGIVGGTLVIGLVAFAVYRSRNRSRYDRRYTNRGPPNTEFQGGFLPAANPNTVVQPPYAPYAPAGYPPSQFGPNSATSLLPTAPEPTAPASERLREGEDLPPPYHSIKN